ncbi:MAG: helix-hairpin-helix domain-containing protein [Thermoleophilaceae bacterium]
MFDSDRRHLIAYFAAAAVLVVIAVRIVGHRGGQAPIPSVSVAAPAASHGGAAGRPRAVAGDRQSIWVDVVGAVRQPGLYALPAGSRVAAAIERAGGVRARAERAAVNLAAKLADGQQIVVPLRGHAAVGAAAAPGGGAAGGAAAGVAGAPATGLAPGARISLSIATQEQLEQLDGIGPGLAGRIIQYREAHGGFRSIDELQEVSGIGDKRFQALKGNIAP